MFFLRSALLTSGLLLANSPAFAHINLDSAGTHLSRYGVLEIKRGPCGRDKGERGPNVYTYEPGSTIHVAIDEFIPHPGYFRIAFDQDGDSHFMNPRSIVPIGRACQADPTDKCGATDFYNNKTVLMDDLNPHTGDSVQRWQWDVKLPDVECDNCTLQIIQIMMDEIHAPYTGTYDSDDVYYQCIDLVLKKGATPSASVLKVK